MKTSQTTQQIGGKLIIRPFRLRDTLSIDTLIRESWSHAYGHLPGYDRIRHLGRFRIWNGLLSALLTHDRMGLRAMLVAECQGQIVGIANASICPRHEINLWTLCMRPGWQKQGIGSTLLCGVQDAYPDAVSIRLEVLTDNEPAIEWYKRKGFSVFASAGRTRNGHEIEVCYMDRDLTQG